MKVTRCMQAFLLFHSILLVKGDSLGIDHKEVVSSFSENSCLSNKEWWLKKGFKESFLPEKAYAGKKFF